MAANGESAIKRANAATAKEERDRDAKLAMQQYRLDESSVLANMKRLRALRLARETRQTCEPEDKVPLTKTVRAKTNGRA
jgi:hypothetical protein